MCSLVSAGVKFVSGGTQANHCVRIEFDLIARERLLEVFECVGVAGGRGETLRIEPREAPRGGGGHLYAPRLAHQVGDPDFPSGGESLHFAWRGNLNRTHLRAAKPREAADHVIDGKETAGTVERRLRVVSRRMQQA